MVHPELLRVHTTVTAEGRWLVCSRCRADFWAGAAPVRAQAPGSQGDWKHTGLPNAHRAVVTHKFEVKLKNLPLVLFEGARRDARRALCDTLTYSRYSITVGYLASLCLLNY